jgi:hypothetical protein
MTHFDALNQPNCDEAGSGVTITECRLLFPKNSMTGWFASFAPYSGI